MTSPVQTYQIHPYPPFVVTQGILCIDSKKKPTHTAPRHTGIITRIKLSKWTGWVFSSTWDVILKASLNTQIPLEGSLVLHTERGQDLIGLRDSRRCNWKRRLHASISVMIASSPHSPIPWHEGWAIFACNISQGTCVQAKRGWAVNLCITLQPPSSAGWLLSLQDPGNIRFQMTIFNDTARCSPTFSNCTTDVEVGRWKRCCTILKWQCLSTAITCGIAMLPSSGFLSG